MKLFTISEKPTKGIEFMKAAEGMNLVGVPFGQGIMKLIELHPIGTQFRLDEADVVPDEDGFRLVKEQSNTSYGDRRALIKIETQAGPGGGIRLASNVPKERFDAHRRRVVREVQNIKEAVGVTVFAQTGGVPLTEAELAQTDEAGPPEFLVMLEPGASFRILRSGRLEGAAPELVVLWTGRWRANEVAALSDRMDDPHARWPSPAELMRPWLLRVWERKARHGEV